MSRSRSLTASTVNAARSRHALAASGGHPALGRPCVEGGQLDLEPGRHPPLGRPYRAHLGARVALNHALIMRAASKPAFLAPSIATQPTGTPGGICTADSRASSPPRLLPVERDADHGQVGVGGHHPRKRGRHPGAGDDHLQAPHSRRVAVLAHLLRVAVGAHHPYLVADARLLQRLAGRLHLRLVVRRAHDDPDQGRVDLDLLECRLDLGHRLGRDRLRLAAVRTLGLRYLHRSFSPSVPGWILARRPAVYVAATLSTARAAMSPRICMPSNEISPAAR